MIDLMFEQEVRERNKYQIALNSLAYANSAPMLQGQIKSVPENFRVTELMEVTPTGEGEHTWLDISKTQLSTDRVAKSLARYANVAYRDVGFSGIKDVRAVTRQWFSVWLPKNPSLDWSGFEMDGVTVHAAVKHSRKIKRSTHKANRFEIRVTGLQGELSELDGRIAELTAHGAPNYFGEQRFGRDANNLLKAESLFVDGRKIKDRNLRSMVLSSARSFLFNRVLSERVKNGSWRSLMPFEPAALDGSNAIFPSNQEPENADRLMALDIHPTAPMWGRGANRGTEAYADLAKFEAEILAEHSVLLEGLERAGLDYQRRSIRSIPQSFQVERHGNDVLFKFDLQTGQFATSILRELVGIIAIK